MVAFSLDDPFANVPPDKASATLHHQQIVKQHFFLDGHNPEKYEFDSDVDSRLSECHVDDRALALLDGWTRFPQRDGMPTFDPVGSADFKVYPTPSLFSESSDSDHSTVGPLSPPCFDPWSAEADECKGEELFGPDEGTHVVAGPEVAFGTPAIFPHAPPSPYPFPLVRLGYGPPPWQHMDGAAAADVRRPPPSYGYPTAGLFPPTAAAHFTDKIRREEDVSHMNLSALWSYGGSMDNGGGAHFSAGAGTINPSVLSSSLPMPPGYRCPQASFNGQEQLQEHDYGVAPVGASGLGSDMQMSMHPDKAETAPSSPSPYPSPDATGPRKHINEACKDISSKKPATSTGKKKRKQSTEKIFACPWPECLQSFARTNNLKVHEKGVHYKIRDHVCPVAGCPKAEANKGFSRKFDLDNHMQKRHPAECGDARTG